MLLLLQLFKSCLCKPKAYNVLPGIYAIQRDMTYEEASQECSVYGGELIGLRTLEDLTSLQKEFERFEDLYDDVFWIGSFLEKSVGTPKSPISFSVFKDSFGYFGYKIQTHLDEGIKNSFICQMPSDDTNTSNEDTESYTTTQMATPIPEYEDEERTLDTTTTTQDEMTKTISDIDIVKVVNPIASQANPTTKILDVIKVTDPKVLVSE